jgi:hypothetical protein
MNKAQAAVILLTGATLGVGGRELAGALAPGEAEAKVKAPYAHAVDLRRPPTSTALSVFVYGTQLAADGGVTRDLGQAKSCKPGKKVSDSCSACMDTLPADCEWP